MADEKKNMDAEATAPPAYTAGNPAPYPQASYPQPTYPQNSYPLNAYPQNAYAQNAPAQPGVTVNHVMYANTQPLANPPPDHLVWSIISTLLCCFWIGIVAIMKSRESRMAALMGNQVQAEEASRQARFYNILSDVLGFVFLGAYIGFLVWYIGNTSTTYCAYSYC